MGRPVEQKVVVLPASTRHKHQVVDSCRLDEVDAEQGQPRQGLLDGLEAECLVAVLELNGVRHLQLPIRATANLLKWQIGEVRTIAY